MHPSLADRDLFVLHIEATDEAGHQGRSDIKVDALERWDTDVIGPVVDALDGGRRAVPDPVAARPRHAVQHEDAQCRAGSVPPLRLDARRRGRPLHRARDRTVRARSRPLADGTPARASTAFEARRSVQESNRGAECSLGSMRPAAPVGIGCLRSLETSPRERFSAVGGRVTSLSLRARHARRDRARPSEGFVRRRCISTRRLLAYTRITGSHSGRCRQSRSRSVGAEHE